MKKRIDLFLACILTGFTIAGQQPDSFATLSKTGSLLQVKCDTNLVTDIEGNTYKTVKIGFQTWMAENLKTTKLNDGTFIPLVAEFNEWVSIYSSAYCWYNNDSTYKKLYGALYNYYTIETEKLCPIGWHMPNDDEWIILKSFLGDSSVGGKLKETGLEHWPFPNEGANNSSGFTALPGRWRSDYGGFVGNNEGAWWSATPLQYWYVTAESEDLFKYGISKRGGISVRCLNDTNNIIVKVPELTTDTIILISKYSAISGGVISFDGGSAITAKGICWSTSPEPDTGDFRITVGGDSYSFTVDLTGLTPDTKYYLRAFAVNQQGFGYGEERVFTTLKELLAYGSVTDIDGNVYKTYLINGFNWIVENLRVTRFNDGTPISNITGNSEWANAICPAYSWYDNDSGTYKHSYGALYNYDVIMNERNICPSGWHVPSPVEWDSLFYLGETLQEDPSGHYHANAGLLAVGSWSCPATNETGFGAVPAGARQGLNFLMEPNGAFRLKNTIACFWLSAGDSRFLLVDYGFSLGGDLHFFHSQFDGYSIRCIENKETLLAIPDTNTIKNTTFEIPVYVYNLPANEVLSYQFNLNYNGETIQFQNFSVEGTLSSNGSIEVNPLENKLSVAWAGQTPLNDSGTILKLRFKALESGSTVLVLTNCLINTDTVRNVENGTITINPGFGDVDGNGNIQAYDAALTLQYSVGLDPLPDSDPLPWEDWRIAVANVDGQDGILAYDASLILQYTVGLINSFPFQTYKKSTYIPQADVAVSIEDGAMVFHTLGQLYGLNITFKENTEFFGAPQVFNTNTLMATNISSSVYSVGVATAYSPAENEILLRIPLINATVQPVNLNLKINNRDKQIVLGMPTGIDAPMGKSIEMYPNPARTILYFKNLVGETTISIYDSQGRKIISRTFTNNQFDISSLDYGLYTIRIEDSKNIIIRKLIKQ